MKYLKPISTLTLALVLIFVAVVSLNPQSVDAKKAPSGGKKSNNSFARDSENGKCKKINGYCVTFSTHGCGNFYIDGRHYGGSRSCQILHIKCPPVIPPTGGSGGGGGITHVTGGGSATSTSTGTSTTTTTTLTHNCTPGVDCLAGDLGAIIGKTLVSPAYAGRNTHSCPLSWVTGAEATSTKITCTLDTGPNRTLVNVPNDPIHNGYPNGYPLPVGKYTLSCTRTTGTGADVSSEKMDREVECKKNPAFTEY